MNDQNEKWYNEILQETIRMNHKKGQEFELQIKTAQILRGT